MTRGLYSALAKNRPVLASFGSSRLTLLAVTVVMAAIRHLHPLSLWRQWDARWYIGIAAHGYHFTIHGKPSLAFFPLFPLSVNAAMHAGIGGVAAGILISNAAFIGALFYLHGMVRRQWGPVNAARVVWLVAFFPTAFFTFAPYSEAIFLLAATGALYHAQRGDRILAGLWVTAALLDRSTGIILIPAVLLIDHFRTKGAWLPVVLPTVAAFIGYAVYLWSEHLPFHALLTAQSAWHRALAFPWVGFTSSAAWLVHSGTSNIPWALENLLQLAVTILFLALTVYAWPALSVPERAYCTGFWFLVLVSPEWMNGYYAPFSSMDRFVLVLFPVAVWASNRLTPHVYHRLLLGFGALMAGSTAMFLAGGWVG